MVWQPEGLALKISVLTACRNAEKTIAHTIESFLAQDHADKEMLIFDGASTDNTVEVVQSYPTEQIRLVSEPDEGMYDALNKGLKQYSGDALGILNADDTYHDQTALSRVSQALSQADIVYGSLNFVHDHIDKQVVRRWRATKRPDNGFKTGWMPAHPTFYVRREVAHTVGDFTTEHSVASDYDWMLRAIELHGFKSRIVSGVLVDMMQGGVSTSGLASYLEHSLESLRVRRKWLGAGLFDYALIAKPTRKIGQFLVRRPNKNLDGTYVR